MSVFTMKTLPHYFHFYFHPNPSGEPKNSVYHDP